MELGLIANAALTIEVPIEQAAVIGLPAVLGLVAVAERHEIFRPDATGAEPYFGM